MDGSIKKKMTISFSENLIVLRGDKTLKEVSDGIGIDVQSLSRYEKGERIPNVDIAKDIADYYGVSLDALYGVLMRSLKILCCFFAITRDYQKTLSDMSSCF